MTGKKTRISSDSAWPLRNAEGKTFAEAKQLRFRNLNSSKPGINR